MTLCRLLPKPARRKGPNPESALVTDILEALALLYGARGMFFKVNSGAIKIGTRFIRMAPPGTPDILGVLAPWGMLVGIEVKLPGEKPTDCQIAWAEKVNGLGAHVAVATSIPEAMDAIDHALWKSGETPPKRPVGLRSKGGR